ncbi:UNVERIFIED_CONTAM: Transposon Tf2-12 polyprotein [Sesamum latifolium]|uniref:Transposon Tf2-12 polyprotein n=1 Tax=Sesamum latifolium TaxID=2727402 RepID=A0AAW2XWY8_9LAMI
MKPFTEAESYFVDVKLYLDPDNMQDVLPSKFSIGYSSEEVHPKPTPIERNNKKFSEATKNEVLTSGKHEVKKPPYSPGFRYVVRSDNKEKKNQPKDHGKCATTQYISTEDGKSSENQKCVSIFNRLGTPAACASIFEQLGETSKDSSNNTRGRQRESVFDRLRDGHAQQFKKKGRYDKTNEHKKSDIGETLHLSRPQGGKASLLIISSGGPIKVKQHVTRKGIQNAPPELEDGIQAIVDELKELNLGTTEELCPIFVSALLNPEEEEQYLRMNIQRDASRKVLRPDLIPRIETEVNKLMDAGFIRETKYPTWISSIVPVKKKNGQIRICVDFQDVNKACLKDDFPLPIIELMVDATIRHEALSFMDGSSGYNQIRMPPKDEECTAFRTLKGIYCYKVMPFGLKTQPTYQRAMQNIFDDMLHKKVECYVDDVVVKTKKREHLADLQIVFDRLRKYNLKMIPLKCAFGVSSGKFLGFIVRYRGIEVDPAKVDAIQKMPPPRNLKELRSLQGNLAFIRRFISNLAARCQPFNQLMKKDAPF